MKLIAILMILAGAVAGQVAEKLTTVVLFYPGASQEVYRVLSKDYKVTSPGCIEIYTKEDTISFCGTYKILKPV